MGAGAVFMRLYLRCTLGLELAFSFHQLDRLNSRAKRVPSAGL